MYRTLLALSLLLSACGEPASHAGTEAAASSYRTIDIPTLKTDLDRKAVPLLVDVRTAEEYASGHVPGAKNVPLDQVRARLTDFGPKDREVYVICQSGNRSAKASALLVAEGYEPVNVAGGTMAWRSAGLPTE